MALSHLLLYHSHERHFLILFRSCHGCMFHRIFHKLLTQWSIPLFFFVTESLSTHVLRPVFFHASIELWLHKDPPPVLPRRQPADSAGPSADSAALGDRGSAASGFGAPVELLLDHLVEKSVRRAKINTTV